MVDRERVLAKLDEMRGYVVELRTIAPATLDGYRRIETKRACERLLQIAVECVIDVCQLLVAGRRLGLPAEEEDLFDKLEAAGMHTYGKPSLAADGVLPPLPAGSGPARTSDR